MSHIPVIFFSFWALYIYYADGFDENGAPVSCGKPIANWLVVYAGSNLLGSVGLLRLLLLIMHCPLTRIAGKILALLALLSIPLGLFSICWFIKGNFDVWGTHPYHIG